MARKNKSFPSCGSFSPVVSFAGGGGGNIEELVLFYFILFSTNSTF